MLRDMNSKELIISLTGSRTPISRALSGMTSGNHD
jgi:hypothetical protein